MTDWAQLARELGSLHEGGESGGTDYAQRAIEVLLGDVAGWGVGLLDQLLYCARVEPASVEHSIAMPSDVPT